MTTTFDYASPPSQRRKSLLLAWITIPLFLGIAGAVFAAVNAHRRSFFCSGILAVSSAGSQSPVAMSTLTAVQASDVAAMTSPSFISAISASSGVPSGVLSSNLSVSAIPGSSLIRVGYTARTAKEAQAVANSVMTRFITQSAGTPGQVNLFVSPRLPTASGGGASKVAALTAFGFGIGIFFCSILQLGTVVKRRR